MSKFGYQSLGFGGGVSAAAGATEQDILDLNPLWWLDPDPAYCFTDAGSTAVSSDGDAVQQWNDRSGNSINFSQATASQQPLWRESGTNGKPYMGYSDSAYRLARTGPAYSTPMTFYMVVAALTSVTQHCKSLAHATSFISYGHLGGVWANSIYTTISNDGMAIWTGRQSLTTQIIQLEAAGTSLPVMRINGGSGINPDGYAYGTSGGAADEDDWTAASSTVWYWGRYNGATFASYDSLAIGDVTHDADTVFSYLGDKYDIAVTAVS